MYVEPVATFTMPVKYRTDPVPGVARCVSTPKLKSRSAEAIRVPSRKYTGESAPPSKRGTAASIRSANPATRIDVTTCPSFGATNRCRATLAKSVNAGATSRPAAVSSRPVRPRNPNAMAEPRPATAARVRKLERSDRSRSVSSMAGCAVDVGLLFGVPRWSRRSTTPLVANGCGRLRSLGRGMIRV